MSCGHCYKCLEGRGCIRAVSFSANCTPNRRPSAAYNNWRDKRMEDDNAAYRRLRSQGLRPAGIDNCAQMEAKARTRYEIEAGVCMPDTIPTKALKSKINQGQEISKANNVPTTIAMED